MTGAALAEDDKDTGGLSEDFVSEVSDTIKRGQSALFVLAESHDPDRMAAYFRGTGGTIIETNLNPYEQQRVKQILAGNY